MSSKRRVPVQLSFADRRRFTKEGKPKNRPGPKPSAFANVRHRPRAVHEHWNPLHVTMRAERGLPSFRLQTLYGVRRIDPCSSARWFQGWTATRTMAVDDGPRPTEQARTVLLRSAWQKYGFIDPGERPSAPS